MKRVWMIGVLLLMIWFAPAVCAQEPDFYASSGADELFSVLPEDAQQILSENAFRAQTATQCCLFHSAISFK